MLGRRIFRGRTPGLRRLARNKIPQQFDGVGPNGPNDCNKLDDVDSPLTALIFGEGLRLLEAARQFMLGQAGLLAGSHHQGAKGGLV
jgi:hypothetical protein